MSQTIAANALATGDTSVSSADSETELDSCTNCGTQLSGVFCHQCGQSSKSVIKFFGEVIKELLDDALGYDSRLKHSILPLIFKPAKLSLEYIKGRRFYYVFPFRLYLITSLLLIILIKSLAHADLESSEQAPAEEATQAESINTSDQGSAEFVPKDTEQQGNQPLPSITEADGLAAKETNESELANKEDIEKQAASDETLDPKDKIDWNDKAKKFEGLEDLEDGALKFFLQRIEPKISQWKANARPLVDSFIESLPYMMFILLPIVALLLKIFYIFSKRYYIEHLIFLLHNHSFVYLMIMISILLAEINLYFQASESGLLQMAGSLFSLMSFLSAIWIFIYIFRAMKTFYRQSWSVTLIKTFAIGILYFSLLALGFLFAFIAGAYQA